MSKGPAVGIFRQAAGAWIVLIVAWGVVAVGGLFWLAGGIANWFTGHGLSGPAFDFQFGRNLFDKGPSRLWPDTPVILIAVVFGLELVTIGIPVAILVVNASRRQRGGGEALRSLAAEQHLVDLTPAGVRRRALALRPALHDEMTSSRERKNLPLSEAGVPLGELQPRGPELRASWEDVALAIMAPRSGKTTAVAIPAILEAPGAAVVTSNKADVWAATWEIRERETGEQAWVFDPQRITYMPHTWWWNPLKGVRSFDAALRLATHFMQEVEQEEGGDEAFWVSAASDVLTALFLAAGLMYDVQDKRGDPEPRQGSLYDVYGWLSDPLNPEPVEILKARDQATAASLDARQTSADDTREGIFEYARTACRCLRSPLIMRWVIPPHIQLQGVMDDDDSSLGSIGLDDLRGDVEFDPVGFARTRQTMYLLSKDGAGGAAPLVAALTDRIMVEATREAERQYRGRLDPPMVVVLDEAANICKIADLPALYSHMGSRGIFVLTILQSRPQAREVWGRGFETMWSAATIKLIGAGIDDPELADDISRLVGDHDISVRSVSTGAGGSYSESIALRKEAIMSTSSVRAMPKGTAILLATGALPASLKLLPWFEGPRRDEIREATRYAQKAMEDAARPARDQPSADELVTVNASRGNGGKGGDGGDVDLRSPAVHLDKPSDDDPRTRTSEQPVLVTSPAAAAGPAAAARAARAPIPLPPGPVPPASAPSTSASTGRTIPVYSQEGEHLGRTTVADDATQDLSEPIASARQRRPPPPEAPAARRAWWRSKRR
jgi:type IV secretory pathway TraG/TraD family ATPase VirD4